MVFRHIYPEDKPFFGLTDKFLKIEVRQSTQLPTTEYPFESDYKNHELVPCQDIKLDLSKVNYSTKDLLGAHCVEFRPNSLIGGSYEDTDPKVYFQEVKVGPCKIIQPGDCEVLIQGVMTNTVDTTEPAALFFQDYVLEISFIEDFGDVSNIESPMARNLVSDIQLRFHSQKTAYIREEFSQLKIDTESGWFKKVTETVSGLFFRTSYSNSSDRFPLDEYE